jgi:hypothetical protein
VIGAFGPKMAELAGRVGDGINTRAAHPRLREMIEIARDAYTRTGRDPTRFLVTFFTELDERGLPVDSPARADLVALGVDRLILIVSPPYDPARMDAARQAVAD